MRKGVKWNTFSVPSFKHYWYLRRYARIVRQRRTGSVEVYIRYADLNIQRSSRAASTAASTAAI